MTIKGILQPDHIPVNKFSFAVVGLIPLVFTQVSGLEEEMDVVDLPDRTRASGGNSQPFEFTAMQPAWHTAEVLAVEAWYEEGRDPISSSLKKPVIVTLSSGTGAIKRLLNLNGVWPSKIKTPDLDIDNEGEGAFYEVTFQCDGIIRT
jgi:hypothetical protein